MTGKPGGAVEAVEASAPEAIPTALTEAQAACLANGYYDTPYAVSADGARMILRRESDGLMCHVIVATGEVAELVDDSAGPIGCAFTHEGNAVIWTVRNAYLCRNDADNFNQFTLGVGGACAVVLGGRVVVFRQEHSEWKTIVLAIEDTALYFVTALRDDLEGVFEHEGRVYATNGFELINLEAAVAHTLENKPPAFTESDLDDEWIDGLVADAEDAAEAANEAE